MRLIASCRSGDCEASGDVGELLELQLGYLCFILGGVYMFCQVDRHFAEETEVFILRHLVAKLQLSTTKFFH